MRGHKEYISFLGNVEELREGDRIVICITDQLIPMMIVTHEGINKNRE